MAKFYFERGDKGRDYIYMKDKKHHDHRHHGREEDFVQMSRRSYDNMVNREIQLRNDSAGLAQQNVSLKSSLQRAEAEIAALRPQAQDYPRLTQHAQHLQHDLDELRRAAENNSSAAQRQVHALGEQLHHQRERNRELKESKDHLEAENETLVQRLRALERQLREGLADRLREELKAWQQRVEELKVTSKRLLGRLDEASVHRRLMESKNARLTSEADQLGAEARRLRAENRELGADRRRLVKDAEDLANDNRALARDCQSQRERIRAYERILRRHGLLP